MTSVHRTITFSTLPSPTFGNRVHLQCQWVDLGNFGFVRLSKSVSPKLV